jgi:hypothetical protein
VSRAVNGMGATKAVVVPIKMADAMIGFNIFDC